MIESQILNLVSEIYQEIDRLDKSERLEMLQSSDDSECAAIEAKIFVNKHIAKALLQILADSL